MKVCAVIGCRNRSNRDVDFKFFRFPSIRSRQRKIEPAREERRARWIEALNRDDFTESKAKNSAVCSAHFITGQPSDNLYHPDYVPSQNMGYKRKLKRYSRLKKRNKQVEPLTLDKQNRKEALNGDIQKTRNSRLEPNEYSSSKCKVEKSFNDVSQKVKEPLEESKSENYVKYREFKNALVSTLRVFQALENVASAYKTPQNVVVQPESYLISKNQTDLLCKKISTLENTIKDVNGVLIDSVIITNEDLQSLHTEYFPGDNSAIRLANSNLKKEIEELKVKITKLESKLLIEEKFPLGQPQTIIYNQSNATTILVVTNDG